MIRNMPAQRNRKMLSVGTDIEATPKEKGWKSLSTCRNARRASALKKKVLVRKHRDRIPVPSVSCLSLHRSLIYLTALSSPSAVQIADIRGGERGSWTSSQLHSDHPSPSPSDEGIAEGDRCRFSPARRTSLLVLGVLTSERILAGGGGWGGGGAGGERRCRSCQSSRMGYL